MLDYCVAGYFFSSELCHHGVKGQKWDVRRYQNEDGSLTELGRKHYYGSSKEQEKLAKSIYSRVSAEEEESKNKKKKKKKKKEKNKKKETPLEQSPQVKDALNQMKDVTEEFNKASSESTPYWDRMYYKMSAEKEKYVQMAVDKYINSHLDKYDGDRAAITQKIRDGVIGGGDKALVKLWMKENGKDEDVKGYRKTIGKTNEAEAKLKQRAKELARDALGSHGDIPVSKLEIEVEKSRTKSKKNKGKDQNQDTKKYIDTAHKKLSQILEDLAKFGAF